MSPAFATFGRSSGCPTGQARGLKANDPAASQHEAMRPRQSLGQRVTAPVAVITMPGIGLKRQVSQSIQRISGRASIVFNEHQPSPGRSPSAVPPWPLSAWAWNIAIAISIASAALSTSGA